MANSTKKVVKHNALNELKTYVANLKEFGFYPSIIYPNSHCHCVLSVDHIDNLIYNPKSDDIYIYVSLQGEYYDFQKGIDEFEKKYYGKEVSYFTYKKRDDCAGILISIKNDTIHRG